MLIAFSFITGRGDSVMDVPKSPPVRTIGAVYRTPELPKQAEELDCCGEAGLLTTIKRIRQL